MSRLHSYPSIYNLDHAAVATLLSVPVYVEEKVDGSQISFGITTEGELMVRSKGSLLHVEAPEKMFAAGVKSIKSLVPLLTPGWTYRGEYLTKPKHNTLAYSRTPAHHIILFDVCPALESYLPYEEKAAEAARIGIEVVPLLASGNVTPEGLRVLLDRESVLGGQKIEGVVVKPIGYSLFGEDKKALLGKFVSEAFKEVHQGSWRESNPTNLDVIQSIIQSYRTPARWQKAVMHLREEGVIENSPRDIGKLVPEVGADVEKECTEEIKQILFDHAWPQIRRGILHGLSEWYKEQLVKAEHGIW
jgi:RNA ligase